MRILITAFLLSVSLLTVFPAQAASRTDVSENTIVLDLPKTVTFQFSMSNYGEVIAKSFPQFPPGKTGKTVCEMLCVYANRHSMERYMWLDGK